MLTVLVIIGYVTWIAGFFVNRITLYQFLVVIPVTMFALRKVGIHIKLGSVIGTEVLLLFFSTAWKALFGKFIVWKFVVNLLLRLIFICIVAYDSTAYVYVSEERKKK